MPILSEMFEELDSTLRLAKEKILEPVHQEILNSLNKLSYIQLEIEYLRVEYDDSQDAIPIRDKIRDKILVKSFTLNHNLLTYLDLEEEEHQIFNITFLEAKR